MKRFNHYKSLVLWLLVFTMSSCTCGGQKKNEADKGDVPSADEKTSAEQEKQKRDQWRCDSMYVDECCR